MEAQALPGAHGHPLAKSRRSAPNPDSLEELDAKARREFAEKVDTQTVGGQLRTFIETGSIRTDLLELICGPEPWLEAMAAIVNWLRTPVVGDA